MNITEEEIWVSNPKFVCLISKMDHQVNKLLITTQGIQEIDGEIKEEYTEEKSNIKVDPLSKKGVSDLLV